MEIGSSPQAEESPPLPDETPQPLDVEPPVSDNKPESSVTDNNILPENNNSLDQADQSGALTGADIADSENIENNGNNSSDVKSETNNEISISAIRQNSPENAEKKDGEIGADANQANAGDNSGESDINTKDGEEFKEEEKGDNNKSVSMKEENIGELNKDNERKEETANTDTNDNNNTNNINNENENETEKKIPKNPLLVFGGDSNAEIDGDDDDDEDDYNYEESEGEGMALGGGTGKCDGIDLCAHQPTFVNLQGLIPRGYTSVLELPKVAPPKVPERPLPGVAPSESLSQLKMRNEGKWAEIGYDPNSGKGNLKCSFTLSNISSAIKKTSITEDNDEKDDLSKQAKSLLLGLEEDDEAPLKLPKPSDHPIKKRVSSSQGPRNVATIHEENEDENEEEEENNDNNGNDNDEAYVFKPYVPGDISQLLDAPILQNNSSSSAASSSSSSLIIREEDETQPAVQCGQSNFSEQSNQKTKNVRKEKTNAALINHTKPSRRGDEAPKKPYKFMREQPPFLERNNMFLTQVEEEQKIARASKNDDSDGCSQKRVFDDQKTKEIVQAYDAPFLPPTLPNSHFSHGNGSGSGSGNKSKRATSILNQRPRIYQPFPTYHPKPPLDLSPYDDDNNKNPKFDAENQKNKIPPRLLEMVKHKPESVVFRALCGAEILQYPRKVVNQVVIELKGYLEKCINNNMIGESSYVDCIISNIKVDLKKLNVKSDDNDAKLEQQIEQTENHYDERKQHWKEKKNILECERDLALEDLELKNQEEEAQLEAEWNSEKMQTRFNKPSPKLIELRHHARALIAAKKFDEAQVIADQIAKQEVFETQEAFVRMQREYRQAHEHLQQKYESDHESLANSYISKMNGIMTAEASDLNPYEKRIENLHKVKRNLEIEKRINAKNHVNETEQQKKAPIAARTPPLLMNAKLKLPPLKAVNTRQSQTRQSQKSSTTPKMSDSSDVHASPD